MAATDPDHGVAIGEDFLRREVDHFPIIEQFPEICFGVFARVDPYVVNGLVARWHVREWTTVVGELAAVQPETS